MKSWKLLGLLPLLILNGCETSTAGIRASCAVFPAPSYSAHHDTPETVAWFEGTPASPGYAVKWDRLCGKP